MTREKKRSSGSSLAADFYEYCRERTPSVILLAVVTFSVWGVWISHDILTFDAEGFYLGDQVNGWLKGWIGVGRRSFSSRFRSRRSSGLFLSVVHRGTGRI